MLEEENEFLLRDLKSVEESYGTDVLTLTVACGYLDRLLTNPKIERYMARHHVDILQALQKLLPDNGMKGRCFWKAGPIDRRRSAFRFIAVHKNATHAMSNVLD